MTALFNNREIAAGIWLVIAAISVGRGSSVRKSFNQLLRSFIEIKIIMPILLMGLYVMGEVLLLRQISLWNISLLKDTLYWFVLSGFLLLMNVVGEKDCRTFFRKTIIGCFAVSVLIGFMLNLYTFPLIGELAFIPVVAFLGAVSVYTEKPEYAESKKVFDGAQILVGIILVVYVTGSLYHHFTELKPAGLLRSILLPVFLTLLFLPFLYLIKLFADYETFFIRLQFAIANDKFLLGYVRIRILFFCHINLFRLNRFEKTALPELWYVKTKADVTQLIENYKSGTLTPETQWTEEGL